MTTIYSKDSFDRFGDDLCEDIFSVFPLEECIKYECVSQQWKRSVFQRVKQLFIYSTNNLRNKLFSNKQINDNMCGLESLLKKLPNITHLSTRTGSDVWGDFSSFESKDRFFELIDKYCHKLKSIDTYFCHFYIDLSKTSIESIRNPLKLIVSNNDNFWTLESLPYVKLTRLNLCGLTNLANHIFEAILLGGIDWGFPVKGLTYLELYCREGDEDFFVPIIRSNKQLKSLNISFCSRNQKTTEDVLTVLSELKELKSLRLRFSYYYRSDGMWDSFRMIGQNCNQLEKLCIDFGDNIGDKEQQWKDIIEYCPNLVTFQMEGGFDFSGSYGKESIISSQSFANCPNMRHLKLSLYELMESFFEDIHKYVPKLNHLSIRLRNEISYQTITDYIERLPELQTLVIDDTFGEINSTLIEKLFENCGRLKSVKTSKQTYVSNHGGITQFDSIL